MSPPPIIARPGLAARPEPHLATPEAPAARPAMPRPFAGRPMAGDPGRGDGPPLRFPADQRRGPEGPRLTLSADDRLPVSGARPRRPGGGAMRAVLFAILVVLAGIGAFTVYHAAAGILHP